jgi:hypothetical protein
MRQLRRIRCRSSAKDREALVVSATGTLRPAFFSDRFQTRESSDNPRVKAFCRVAPTVLFKVRAILSACVFCRANVFNVRTCSVVHARRFDCLFINFLQDRKPVVTICLVEQCQFCCRSLREMINGLIHRFGSSVASAFLTFDWEIPNCRAILASVMPALKAARTAFI